MTDYMGRLLALGLGVGFSVTPAAARGELLGGDSDDWESKRTAAFELDAGLYYPDSEELQTVFGSNGLFELDLTLGYSLGNLLRLDGGVGLLMDRGYATGDASGETSAELEKLTLATFHAGPVLRLDLFREQPIVPYGSVGVSWAIFKDTVASDPSSTVMGDKSGWYYGFGAELLLDRLQPSRASDLDISRGINDSFITLDYRRQSLTEVGGEGDEGLDFSANVFAVGLKFDF